MKARDPQQLVIGLRAIQERLQAVQSETEQEIRKLADTALTGYYSHHSSHCVRSVRLERELSLRRGTQILGTDGIYVWIREPDYLENRLPHQIYELYRVPDGSYLEPKWEYLDTYTDTVAVWHVFYCVRDKE